MEEGALAGIDIAEANAGECKEAGEAGEAGGKATEDVEREREHEHGDIVGVVGNECAVLQRELASEKVRK